MKIAVVTGASSGMGREFVCALDRQTAFDEIWVIARRRDRLEALQGAVHAKVRPLAWDLTKEESFDAYRSLLAEERPEVSVLVNAGGFGVFGAFASLSESEQLSMIDLNVKTLMRMTHLTLPYMKAGACIYQLGSLSAFQPVPYINVYAATKAFVLHFSRALNKELEPRGIRVLAVCPGWVRTEFFDRAVRDDTITYYNQFFTAKEVVDRALSDMARGKDVSVCGWRIRAQVLLTKLLSHRIVMDIWCRQQGIGTPRAAKNGDQQKE